VLQPIAARELSLVSSSGLRILATTDAASPLVDAFYADYDRAFVLPNEKEELAGFRDCLALNHGEPYQALERRYGPFREIVLVARHPDTGASVGGANLIAFPVRPRESTQTPMLSVNLNYVYVVPGERRKGYFTRLARGIPEIAAAWFRVPSCDGAQDTLSTLVFIEQNDPLRMSPAECAADTEYSGIDQFERIRMWTRLGARIVDFPYVQPPLSSAQRADDTLLYSVYGAAGATLSACHLHDHLERFFGISVLKGKDPYREPAAAAQLRRLRRACSEGCGIALLDPSSWLEAQNRGQAEKPSGRLSLRDVVRSHD
jgi:hypothetical protein